jgi:hypothetical protein
MEYLAAVTVQMFWFWCFTMTDNVSFWPPHHHYYHLPENM